MSTNFLADVAGGVVAAVKADDDLTTLQVLSADTDELRDQLTEALSNILLGEKIPLDVVNSETGEIIIPANRKITKTLLRKLATVYDRIEIDPSPIRNKINEIIGQFKKKFEELNMQREEELGRAEAGEDVDPGIIKSVKVYIA